MANMALTARVETAFSGGWARGVVAAGDGEGAGGAGNLQGRPPVHLHCGGRG